MEFEHDGEKYRVDRGVGTGKWLLLHNVGDGKVGWRLLRDYPAHIHEVDVVDHVKSSLNAGKFGYEAD